MCPSIHLYLILIPICKIISTFNAFATYIYSFTLACMHSDQRLRVYYLRWASKLSKTWVGIQIHLIQVGSSESETSYT